LARIILVSGAAGTGKTSITEALTKKSTNKFAARIQYDDFNDYILKGFISPWLEGARNQNETVYEAIVASAQRFSVGGYEVYIDGVITPNYLAPWKKAANEGYDVRYIVLRPDLQTTIKRVTEREQNINYPLEHEFVKNVWNYFSDMGQYESHIIDTSTHNIDESLSYIQNKLNDNAFRLI